MIRRGMLCALLMLFAASGIACARSADAAPEPVLAHPAVAPDAPALNPPGTAVTALGLRGATPARPPAAAREPETGVIAVRAAQETALQRTLAARRAAAAEPAASAGAANVPQAAYFPAEADADGAPTGGVAAQALFEAIRNGTSAAAAAAAEEERAAAFDRLLERAANAKPQREARIAQRTETHTDEDGAQSTAAAMPSADTGPGDIGPGDTGPDDDEDAAEMLLGGPPAAPVATMATGEPADRSPAPAGAATGLQTYEDLFAPVATRETRRRGVVLIERDE